MIVELDTSSPVPAYEQLRQQIRTMIVSGVLPTGERLPTIRRLADDLDLSPGTVARAYGELETDGLVITGGRKGTRVGDVDRWSGDEDPQKRLRAAARQFALATRQLGIKDGEAVAAVRRALAATAPETVSPDAM